MIETTPEQIVIAAQGDAWKKLNDVAKPADVAWEIHTFMEAMQKTIEFYDRRRLALLDELATKAGDKYEFESDEKGQEFAREHAKLWQFPLKLGVDKLERKHTEAAELTVGETFSIKWALDYEALEIEDPFA